MKREKKDKHFIHKPTYPGGLRAMRAFIQKHMKYPAEALEYRKEGVVKLRYEVDYKGRVTEVFILKSLGYGCDEEAERLVRLFRFDIAKNRKLKVSFHKTLQIHFRLPPVKKKKPEAPKATPIKKIVYTYSTQPADSSTAERSYHYSIPIKK